MKSTKNKKQKHPSEDAFLTNPVASPTDRTGFAVTVPQDDYEAENISDMFENLPLTSHKEDDKRAWEYHNKDNGKK